MTEKTIFERFIAAQAEIGAVAKAQAANAGKARYRYADISDVLLMVRPVLNKHGLCLMQKTETSESTVTVETFLYDAQGNELRSGGFTVSTHGLMQSGVQAHGSAITYARRYSLVTFIGVAYGDDDDGHQATNSQPQDVLTQQDVDEAQQCADQGKEAMTSWMERMSKTRPAAYLEYKNLGWAKTHWAQAVAVSNAKEQKDGISQ